MLLRIKTRRARHWKQLFYLLRLRRRSGLLMQKPTHSPLQYVGLERHRRHRGFGRLAPPPCQALLHQHISSSRQSGQGCDRPFGWIPKSAWCGLRSWRFPSSWFTQYSETLSASGLPTFQLGPSKELLTHCGDTVSSHA